MGELRIEAQIANFLSIIGLLMVLQLGGIPVPTNAVVHWADNCQLSAQWTAAGQSILTCWAAPQPRQLCPAHRASTAAAHHRLNRMLILPRNGVVDMYIKYVLEIYT